MNLLENQKAAERVDGIYMDLETILMQNIAKHLSDWQQPIDTDKWLLRKLAEIGKLNKENIKLIAQMSGMSQTAAERMLEEASKEAIKAIDPGLKTLAAEGLAEKTVDATKSRNVLQAMEALNKQAKDSLNKCNTVMLYKARDEYQRLITQIAGKAGEIANKQTFLDILGKHATATTIGIESRQQAVRECIKEFNARGIPAFVDKAGREWTPEAYVNMNMRNTARQTAEEVQTARCKDAGVKYIAIDSHSGARPKCAKDQGKIFSLDDSGGEIEDLNGKKIKVYPWSSSSFGEPDGILGINCGHHKRPFIPGVHIQRHFPTEDYDANDKLYKETQVQRALERDVRKQKRECMLYDEIGDKDAFEEAAVKLKAKEAKLKNYVDGNGNLHRRKDREEVVGFDKDISTRASVTNRNSIRIGSEQNQYREYLGLLKDGKVTLRSEQQKILDKIPNKGDWAEVRKKQVKTKDLAALTAATGHEFAIFTGSNTKIIVHGTSTSWHIPHEAWKIIEENQYEWTSHSHPTIRNLQASDPDRRTLELFTWQKESDIIDLQANIITFTASEQDWFNESIGVKKNDKQGKRKRYSWPDTD
jgi:hypothetical protein